MKFKKICLKLCANELEKINLLKWNRVTLLIAKVSLYVSRHYLNSSDDYRVYIWIEIGLI